MNRRRAILVILDGMTDEAFSLADYPNLAALSEGGAHGITENTPKGFSTESYTCIASLLGLRSEEIGKNARGYLEALGAGIRPKQNELVLRATWVALEHGLVSGFAEAPGEDIKPEGAEYRSLGGYKAMLFVAGAAGELDRIKTFPPYEHDGEPFEALLPEGNDALRELTLKLRSTDRALIPWGEARECEFPRFSAKAAAVTGTGIVRGLCSALGIEVKSPPFATGDTDTNLIAKAELALELAAENQLVILHINGADEAAHRKNAGEKHDFLARVDRELIPMLMRFDGKIMVTADHSTSPVTGKHFDMPQPFLLSKAPQRGELGLFCGCELINLLMEDK